MCVTELLLSVYCCASLCSVLYADIDGLNGGFNSPVVNTTVPGPCSKVRHSSPVYHQSRNSPRAKACMYRARLAQKRRISLPHDLGEYSCVSVCDVTSHASKQQYFIQLQRAQRACVGYHANQLHFCNLS